MGRRRRLVARGQKTLGQWVKSHKRQGSKVSGHWRKGKPKKPRRRDYIRAKIVKKGKWWTIRANGELLGGGFMSKIEAERYAKNILGVKKVE